MCRTLNSYQGNSGESHYPLTLDYVDGRREIPQSADDFPRPAPRSGERSYELYGFAALGQKGFF